MEKMDEWTDGRRNQVAAGLRAVAEDAPPITASWLREVALAIDNN